MGKATKLVGGGGIAAATLALAASPAAAATNYYSGYTTVTDGYYQCTYRGVLSTWTDANGGHAYGNVGSGCNGTWVRICWGDGTKNPATCKSYFGAVPYSSLQVNLPAAYVNNVWACVSATPPYSQKWGPVLKVGPYNGNCGTSPY
ncbi:MAG: hypothetical protein U0V73_03680 [Acidimicrobiia bacterium]